MKSMINRKLITGALLGAMALACGGEGDASGGGFVEEGIPTMKTPYMDHANRLNDECSYVDGYRVTTA